MRLSFQYELPIERKLEKLGTASSGLQALYHMWGLIACFRPSSSDVDQNSVSVIRPLSR